MTELTKKEELILLSILRLRDNAYGITIQQQIKEATGHEYLYNTLYTTLEQLVRKSFIVKRFGDPTSERGGKRKIYFDLTEQGLEVLEQAFQNQQSVWAGISVDFFRQES